MYIYIYIYIYKYMYIYVYRYIHNLKLTVIAELCSNANNLGLFYTEQNKPL